ncbi:MAG: hypothetical protein IPG31_01925 [Nitrosomonas sp.]|nr:hypothetical protein [Nitrosomonas sp.]
MKHLPLYFSLLASLWLASTAPANPQQTTIRPFVKSSFAQIQNMNSGKPFLLTFWAKTCSYCMDELASLGKMQEIYPKYEIVVVATDPLLDKDIVWQILTTHDLRLAET